MNLKFNFTIEQIEKLKPSKKRHDLYSDVKVQGLWLRVTDTGNKSFLVHKWNLDRMHDKFLGKFDPTARQSKDFDTDPLCVVGNNPGLNVEQARKLARAYIAALAAGNDPTEQITRAREEMTLKALFNEYLDKHAKKSRKTADVMAKEFERNAGSLKNLKLSKITHAMAEKLHSDLGTERGPYTANRTVQLLRAVYNKGKTWQLYFGDNPFAGISLFPEKPRERFLTTKEVAELLKVLRAEPEDLIRDFIYLALLTGVRKANLCSMRWQDIDLVAGKWTIPDTKNNTSQHITLGVSELAILRQRKEMVSGDFVFPGSGKTKHLVDPKKSWTNIRERAGIPDCTIHDLRRSLGSGMAAANVNVALIKSALHHKDMKTTLNVYAHTQEDAVLQAKQRVHNQWFRAAGLTKRKKRVRKSKQSKARVR